MARPTRLAGLQVPVDMDVEKLIEAARPQGVAPVSDLCVGSSDPDQLALTETFRLCRGYATDAISDKAFAYLETVLHSPTTPFRAYLLHDVQVLGSGHLLMCKGRMVAESRNVFGASVEGCVRESLASGVEALADDTTWIVIGNVLDGGNHWHWLAQSLPGVLQSLVFAHDLGLRKIGLVTPPLGQAQSRSLELLGLSGLPRAEISKQQTFAAASAIFSDIQSSVGWMRASSFRRSIADALRQSVERSSTGTAPLIYVSRSDATKRPMLNEPELEHELRDRGFRVVRCSDYSLDEQIALFSEADLIVGPHGAGLANVMFARNAATVYELQQESYPNATIAALSRIAGCAHWVDYFPDDGKAGDTEGWHCNVQAVLRTLHVLDHRDTWQRICRAARVAASNA